MANRPCGCPEDYHLNDCPILRPPIEEPEFEYDGDDERDWYTRSLNGDY